ncbi:MAG: SAM-dependent methyltransferase [Verrucomicrobiota bacterium]
MTRIILPSDEVDRRLRQWMESSGSEASFEEFFDAALYHPEFGYYSNNIRTVGNRGDFSTSASLDPSLARAIARWIVVTSRLEQPRVRDVIEIGAGDGSLASSVLRFLPWLLRRSLNFHIVDRSLPLRDKQKEILRGKGNVQWHESVEDALATCKGRAFLFSNELVDAFPPRVFQWVEDAKSWKEVYLSLDKEGNLLESLKTNEDAPSAESASSFRDGQRIERHDSYARWLDTWINGWNAGEMLTIDYGDDFPALYHRRPRGTIRGFFHHVRIEAGPEIYTRFGHHDLTTDINFTALTKHHLDRGLTGIANESQGDFIERFAPEKKTPLPAITEARNAFRCLRFKPPES